MGVGAGLYVYVVVVQKFTFAISSPDEFLFGVLTITYSQDANPNIDAKYVKRHGSVPFEGHKIKISHLHPLFS